MAGALLVPTFIGRKLPPELVRTDAQQSAWTPTTAGTVKTITGVPIGSASTDRYVVLACGGTGGSTDAGVQSVTIGGVPASSIYVASQFCTFWGALVPTGTTATIVATLSASATEARLPMHVFALKKYNSLTPIFTETSAIGPGSTPQNTTLNASGQPGAVNLVGLASRSGLDRGPPGSISFSPLNGNLSTGVSGQQSGMFTNNGTPQTGSVLYSGGLSGYTGSGGSVRMFNLVWS